MGEQRVKKQVNTEQRIAFMRHLLRDVQALEMMLEQKMFETGITRIGAEQECCIVTPTWRPAECAQELLEKVQDDHFTTELAKYNIEVNLDPMELTGNCFSLMENHLREMLDKGQQVARSLDSSLLLTGILPTISKHELEFDFMTPNPRYWALNEMIKRSRGTDFSLYIRGIDELSVQHDSVLFEACNTSFQLHLQVDPDDFVAAYNWSQAIAGPVLSVCCNSPLLLGRELWSETRIALFQQSIDTRSSSLALTDKQARVSFGSDWEFGSIADIYKNNIAEHEVLLARDIEQDALALLQQGKTPKLKALGLHNGTVYKWNRACYGVGGGKAHTRIENRYIPAGPTVLDEMANFAFWIGLMLGRPDHIEDVANHMDFREAKGNFIKAARNGKHVVLDWFGNPYSAADLIVETLLPMAKKGLESQGIDQQDIDRLLKIIEDRAKGSTGADWQVRNFRKLKKHMKADDALVELTRFMEKNAASGEVVANWPDVELTSPSQKNASSVGHIMSTQMFTVKENDLAQMATEIMKWKDIHHVPVENDKKELIGLLTWTHVKRHFAGAFEDEALVSEVMTRSVTTVTSKTSIRDAIDLMKSNEFGCLPVVDGKQLIGIITIKDVIDFD